MPTAVLLAVVAVITHVAVFQRAFWNPDEGFLATQARILGDGAQLYGGVVDRKPPVVPYLYAAAFQLFGSGALWPIKVLVVAAHLATAVLLAVFARRRFGPTAGLMAGVLYLVASIGLAPPDAMAANFETFMLPASVAAIMLADRGRFAAAGFAAAVAALTKQSGGAVVLPVLWVAVVAAGRERGGRGVGGGRRWVPGWDRCRGAVVGVGAWGLLPRSGIGGGKASGGTALGGVLSGRVVPGGLTLNAVALSGSVARDEVASGHAAWGVAVRRGGGAPAVAGDDGNAAALGEGVVRGGVSGAATRLRRLQAVGCVLLGAIVPWVGLALLLGAGRFVFWVVTGSGGYLSLEGGWLRAVARASGNLGIVAAAGLPLVWAAWRGRRFRADADLWVWLAASAVGVAAGTRFFGHYFLQLLPPLVLLGVAGVARGALRWRTVAGYAALSATVFLYLAATWPQVRLDHIRGVAATVRAETRPGEPLLVWGMNPAVYYFAERPPATRFLTAGFLTNFAGGRPDSQVGEAYAVPGSWAQFTEDLTRTRPELVIDDSGNAAYRPERIPRFDQFLKAHYRELERQGSTVIYRRIDP